MSTNPTATHFPVLGNRDLALVRVEGPGICRESGRFESVLLDVEKRGYRVLVIDLAECPRIDSTFAGALLRLGDRAAGRLRVLLAGARGAVQESLDNLLLGQVFETVMLPDTEGMERVEVAERDLSREEIMALSLDGHERLSALSAANARRFAALIDVMRSQSAGSAAPCEGVGTGNTPVAASTRG